MRPPKHLWNIGTVTFEAGFGYTIHKCIQDAIDFSEKNKWTEYSELGPLVSFEFNGVTVSVKSDSNLELIVRDWCRAMSGSIEKEVGPYPKPVLTDEENEKDARIKAKNEQSQQRWQAKHDKKAAAERNATDAKLADAPEMEIADEDAWRSWKDNNRDVYGGGVIAYAERWARLMQVGINAGKKLEDIANTTSREADIDGITGFMYGAAVQALATNWKYGDQLHTWYNEQYGKSEDTEGTVNLVTFTVSTD